MARITSSNREDLESAAMSNLLRILKETPDLKDLKSAEVLLSEVDENLGMLRRTVGSRVREYERLLRGAPKSKGVEKLIKTEKDRLARLLASYTPFREQVAKRVVAFKTDGALKDIEHRSDAEAGPEIFR